MPEKSYRNRRQMNRTTPEANVTEALMLMFTKKMGQNPILCNSLLTEDQIAVKAFVYKIFCLIHIYIC